MRRLLFWFFLPLWGGCAPQPSEVAPPAAAPVVIEPSPGALAPSAGAASEPTPAPPPSNEDAVSLARRVVTMLAKRELGSLAKVVHPQRGVRFSPYAFVEQAQDVVLTSEQLARAWNDSSKRRWGSYDGSGDPIELDFAGYFARFVYDVDYAAAPQVAKNRMIGSGNTTNNLADAYPRAEFVEFHFPGFDPTHQGMDWRSLRLVFVRDDGRLWLVGIVHDQWTI